MLFLLNDFCSLLCHTRLPDLVALESVDVFLCNSESWDMDEAEETLPLKSPEDDTVSTIITLSRGPVVSLKQTPIFQ